MDNHASPCIETVRQRYASSLALENPNAVSCQTPSTRSGQFSKFFFGNRSLEEGVSLNQDFHPFKSSEIPRIHATATPWMWLFCEEQNPNHSFDPGDYNDQVSDTSPIWKDYHRQYSISESLSDIPFFDQIYSRLRAQDLLRDNPKVDNALWLQTNIRSLFELGNPHSSSLQYLNKQHPNVHFDVASFADSEHAILSSVMVSSGTNAQVIFLNDTGLKRAIPLDSSGVRSWIMQLSGESPSNTEEMTKVLSKVEASSLLVLLEFVRHFLLAGFLMLLNLC
ncbi:hypothetical protein DL96DRAFT_249343 [Flagelloscypha sp. PMI_526]|nr:hypothetical protein DL96DRAFT_249343 [Flagelloscypha sp. PMI_526]